MRANYAKYLSYVLRHKWYVFLASWRLGVPLLGLVHDWTKLGPAEFGPYARQFCGTRPQVRDKTGYYKPEDTGNPEFEAAWRHHWLRNKHHWQRWSGAEIPEKYVREMVADWVGAGAAQGKPDTRGWWEANNSKMMLHPETRLLIERLLCQLRK